VPIAGRKPNEDRSAVLNRNKVADFTEVDDVPFAGAPPLRQRQTGGVSVMAVGAANSEDYPEATKQWWAAISTMPHAALWGPAEWELAMAGAEIHARTMEAWRGYTGGQMLQVAKQLGVTADHRRDLRIRYVKPKAKPKADELPADVARLDDYRDL
jgi:hypothetical protein